ncbi:peptidase U32 family protein [Butyrivibrio proteoclasticus]|uniref:peptidase U32 family protein n=1 Tax=Butyrivibrio proteoclasticus TaxID=43305 RepID=UPI00054DCA40|nr:U32 family peptidase [Butyrivibrio proteoclasticus]
MKKPELLIPASSLEVLKTAVMFGADAVFIGGDAFGLRAKAKNFSPEEMKEGIEFAHAHGVEVHVTVNILAHNYDLDGVEKYLHELKDMGPDALIIADPGIFMKARRICPEIDIHVSTQANNTNYETYNFWHDLGAKRVVAARELSLNEIKEITSKIPDDLEMECFIHGAMCISYSGRCLLSNYFTGRDANKGACTHPCRWKYAVVEEKRPGEYLPVYENDRGTYIFNSKDLCMIEHIPEMVDAGIDSFKIEGRMKTALYVATVARTYRKAIDDYFESEEKYRQNMPWYLDQISKCTYRQFTTGFYFGKPTYETQIYDNNTYVNEYIYLGIVGDIDDRGYAKFEQRNKFCVGDEIEIMKPDGTDVPVTVRGMYAEDGTPVESCPHSKQILFADLSVKPEKYDILRVKSKDGSGDVEPFGCEL